MSLKSAPARRLGRRLKTTETSNKCILNSKAISNHSAINGHRLRQHNEVLYQISAVCEEAGNSHNLRSADISFVEAVEILLAGRLDEGDIIAELFLRL